MTDANDYDENDDDAVDDDEAQAAEKGATVSDATVTDTDQAAAETLTVTAKNKQRQSLEDELAQFLASGGRITEVPPDESAYD